MCLHSFPSVIDQVPAGTVAGESIAQPSHLNFFLVSQEGKMETKFLVIAYTENHQNMVCFFLLDT